MELKEVINKAKIINDIKEIENVIYNPIGFDKQKAIQIIGKHHFFDWNIKISDMILNVNYDTLQASSDVQIANYLCIINIYLYNKLAQ